MCVGALLASLHLLLHTACTVLSLTTWLAADEPEKISPGGDYDEGGGYDEGVDHAAFSEPWPEAYISEHMGLIGDEAKDVPQATDQQLLSRTPTVSMDFVTY